MSATRIVKGISRTISLVFAGLALAATAAGIPVAPHPAQAIAARAPADGVIPVRAPAAQPIGAMLPPLAAGAPTVRAIPPTFRAIQAAARGAPGVSAAAGSRSRPSQIALTSYSVLRYRTPRRIARSLLHRFDWRKWQFRYLDWLWEHESGWNRYAYNPYSGAYGIPQAVPGGVMASAGPGWRWNARTQILWGMRYIRERYGSPYWAWQHELAYNWY